jgi:hypothetical protein
MLRIAMLLVSRECSPYGRRRWRVLDIAARPFGLGAQATLLWEGRGPADGILILGQPGARAVDYRDRDGAVERDDRYVSTPDGRESGESAGLRSWSRANL